MKLSKIKEIARRIAGLKKDEEDLVESQDGGGSSGGFIGKGKLTEYKGKEDSWILHQMDKGVEKGIPLEKGKDGQWELEGYKKREKLIATNIINKLS